MKFDYMSRGRYIYGDWLINRESGEWVIYFAYQRVGALPTKRACESFIKELI